MNKSINTFIFDYGCVLSRPQDTVLQRKLADLLNVRDMEGFEEIYYRLRPDYDMGIIDGKEYWKRICLELGQLYDETVAENLIALDAESWTNLDMQMIDFVVSLRESSVKTAVLSNMPPEILDYIKAETDLLSLFDEEVFSCDLGLIKPDPEIYRICLDKTGSRSDEAVFIDDREENVSAAIDAGINGILYSDYGRFIVEMEKLTGRVFSK